eukprot:COSAG02_NODE_33416_length_500_cov_0.955112_1_plen_56_part_10
MALGEVGAALVKMMRSCQTELLQSNVAAPPVHSPFVVRLLHSVSCSMLYDRGDVCE